MSIGNFLGLGIAVYLLLVILLISICRTNIVFFAFCYSVFKRARMYYQLKKEIKRVRQENKTILEATKEEKPIF